MEIVVLFVVVFRVLLRLNVFMLIDEVRFGVLVVVCIICICNGGIIVKVVMFYISSVVVVLMCVLVSRGNVSIVMISNNRKLIRLLLSE